MQEALKTSSNNIYYRRNPISFFQDYKYVSWDKEIYSLFKGNQTPNEVDFYADIIIKRKCSRILDLASACGNDLSGILKILKFWKHPVNFSESNDIDPFFIDQASRFFNQNGHSVLIHNSDWTEMLQNAVPPYTQKFDFMYLVGNSFLYYSNKGRSELEKRLDSFCSLLDINGYFLIDLRNFSYIKSFIDRPHDYIMRYCNLNKSVCYHGVDRIKVYPGYISNDEITLHYYDETLKNWSHLSYFPLNVLEMRSLLEERFIIEEIFYDYGKEYHPQYILCQILARKR